MKIAIVYDSITGNTKKIAEELKKEINGLNLVYFGEPQNVEADLYIVGSWTDKGMCSKKIIEFLKQLKNKKIAYFGTAGFGGSKEYYEKLSNRVKEIIDSSNEVLGYFHCQGKMPMSIRDRYVKLITDNPEDKNIQVSIENFDEALLHPNYEDIINAKKWIKSIVS
ncbi:flavodoxin family protein [Clostridium tertium]|jgi:flavodoxin I|uniref:flavodoxin family protein BilS n=3 Tax=Clostridium TaxID=1485 RepID=UPI00232C5D6A|nr:flavodoxin family protein BilS [Clostridium tertium]MDB1935120.1 flavodoxin family protein [Clostridium tertium]MDB1938425.1 flavodoxin family protein [Clostridium tertium]